MQEPEFKVPPAQPEAKALKAIPEAKEAKEAPGKADRLDLPDHPPISPDPLAFRAHRDPPEHKAQLPVRQGRSPISPDLQGL
jgi:hypothetical protein